MTSPRMKARDERRLTYSGKRCPHDGSREYYTESGECVECQSYHHAVKELRIEGVDGRTEGQKAVKKLQEKYRK